MGPGIRCRRFLLITEAPDKTGNINLSDRDSQRFILIRL